MPLEYRGEVPARNINVGILFKVTGLRSPQKSSTRPEPWVPQGLEAEAVKVSWQEGGDWCGVWKPPKCSWAQRGRLC